MPTALRDHDESVSSVTNPKLRKLRNTQPAQILLLSLPFGLPYMPSLGLSLLKAGLATRGIDADVRYLGLDFAHLIGYSFYQRLAHGGAGFPGDWIFYPALYGSPSAAQTEHFWQLTSAAQREDATSLAALQEQVTQAQDQASAFIERCLTEIDWSLYRMVGFTTMFQQNLASLAMAKRIKETYPHIQILFGGPNAEGDMGAGLMACFPFIDYVFSGESDHTFPEFAQAALADDSHTVSTVHVSLRGIHSRDTDGTVRRPSQWGEPINDMDALPYPNFDDFFPQFHAAFPDLQPHLNYETARGCWWGAKSHCTFCGLNGVTMAFRSKSADRAIEEIQYLHQHYMDPYRVLLMQPADQILDLGYFESMIPRLPEAAPGVPTFFEVKANLTRGQVKALAAAQVQIIQPGIESLSSQVLTLMRKGCTLLQNIQLLKWCAEFGLHPIWNWLYGFPGECEEDYQQMSEVVPIVTHLQPPKKFFAIELDRFSPYFTAPDKLGVKNIRPPEILSVLYPFAPEHQFDICYTFDFDYTETREPSTYLGSSRERVSRLWMKTRQRGALVGFQTAERLVIWDSRIGAVNRWVEISGTYREALLLADKILSDKQLHAFFAERLGEAQAAAAREDFLTRMEQRGLILRENGRSLSLVVLSSITDELPEVPADELAHLAHPAHLAHLGSASELGLADLPSTAPVAFGGKAVNYVLAGPADDSERHRVVLAGSLICTPSSGDHAVDSGQSDIEAVHGVCVVESFWGVSAFRVAGTVQIHSGEKTRLDLAAERVSGFDAGSWTLSFEHNQHNQSGQSDATNTAFSGTALYRDAINTSLSMRMELAGLNPQDSPIEIGDTREIRFKATGDGFLYASFLASGESLGGAEGS